MRRHPQRGRLDTGCAVLLAGAAVVLTLLWLGGLWRLPFVSMGWSNHVVFPGFRPFIPLSIWGLIQAGLAVWVGVDANRRGLNGVLWGLLVFFTGIVGLIVYLLVGPAMQQRNGGSAPALSGAASATPTAAAEERCPSCGAGIAADFKACPHCAAPLQCRHCGKRVQGGWKVCPYCTTPLG